VEFKECIKNDVFEAYYPYFNMKKHFNKLYLNQFNYNVLELAKTKWFKNSILSILNR